jgi:predicted alpha/beta-fold hydrolase
MSEDVRIRELQTETIDQTRRRFFGTAAMTIAAAQLGVITSAAAQTGKAASNVSAIKPGTNTSFKALKQINAGLLNVGYAEDGPAEGPSVVLLHGWPYDIHSYVDVAPLLAAKGYRVIVPYLRGQCNHAKRPAVGRRPRHDRSHGCAQDPESDLRRL